MVRGLLPRRLDEASYELAMVVEETGTLIEAAFCRREVDRWFLHLASPAVDASGATAVREAIRALFERTGRGGGSFDMDDVRAIGTDDENLLHIRLEGLMDALDVPGAPEDPFSVWPCAIVEAARAVPNPVFVGHSTGACTYCRVQNWSRRSWAWRW